MSETYRRQFGAADKARQYEQDMLHSRSYSEVLWEIEKEQLGSAIADLRRTHPRIEALDFAAGTGRITSFVENLVDSCTAIEISHGDCLTAHPACRFESNVRRPPADDHRAVGRNPERLAERETAGQIAETDPPGRLGPARCLQVSRDEDLPRDDRPIRRQPARLAPHGHAPGSEKR